MRLGQELRVATIDPRRLQQYLQLEQTRNKTGPLKRELKTKIFTSFEFPLQRASA
jgi:hypothetical protein